MSRQSSRLYGPVFTEFECGSGGNPGKYKLEVVLITEDGAEKDQKAAPFTVSGLAVRGISLESAWNRPHGALVIPHSAF